MGQTSFYICPQWAKHISVPTKKDELLLSFETLPVERFEQFFIVLCRFFHSEI